jgi:predicted  nucleic acid-binding Zn-ribbon protein
MADQASHEADSLRNEMKHFDDTLKIKDDEIEFLRSLVHQLSEKLPKALPEFTEEERKKRWWQFWRAK